MNDQHPHKARLDACNAREWQEWREREADALVTLDQLAKHRTADTFGDFLDAWDALR